MGTRRARSLCETCSSAFGQACLDIRGKSREKIESSRTSGNDLVGSDDAAHHMSHVLNRRDAFNSGT